MAVWDNNDAAAAKELYMEDSKIFWPEGSVPPTIGIDAIASTVKGYPLDPIILGDAALTYVPSDEEMGLLNATYKDSHFIAFPVRVGSDVYQVVLETHDGKVQNQWVSPMFRFLTE